MPGIDGATTSRRNRDAHPLIPGISGVAWRIMSGSMFNQLLLLVTEAVVIGVVLLSFFRLRHRFGLAPLYMTLGSFQHLQTMLASSLYVEILPGIVVSPGSTVLFTSTLFVVLLVYIREDANKARSLIVGAVAANLTLSAVVLITSLHLDGAIASSGGLDAAALLQQNLRTFLVGTGTFMLDVVLIIVLYEFFFGLFPRSLFLRIVVSMLVVVTLDTLIFTLAAFYDAENTAAMIRAGIIGKTGLSLVFSGLLTGYLRLFSSPRKRTDDTAHGARDLFAMLTYRQRYQLLKDELGRDAMTGLYNRGFFNENLDRELARAARLDHELCLIIVDIDHFKAINDNCGHQTGDQVIRTMADAMKRCFRRADIACRFGGEEFVVIMPDASGDAALRATQRLQELFREACQPLDLPHTDAVTFTAGIATYPLDAATPEVLLRVADARLYHGKRSGRNRIET
ncbi:MAG: diguanylate cyclase, partial [Woeseia sp.]